MNQSEDLKERVRVLQQELERKRLLLQKAEKKPKSACIRRSSTLLPVVEETSSEVSVPECSGEFLCDENVTVTTANFINIKSLESSESSMQGIFIQPVDQECCKRIASCVFGSCVPLLDTVLISLYDSDHVLSLFLLSLCNFDSQLLWEKRLYVSKVVLLETVVLPKCPGDEYMKIGILLAEKHSSNNIPVVVLSLFIFSVPISFNFQLNNDLYQSYLIDVQIFPLLSENIHKSDIHSSTIVYDFCTNDKNDFMFILCVPDLLSYAVFQLSSDGRFCLVPISYHHVMGVYQPKLNSWFTALSHCSETSPSLTSQPIFILGIHFSPSSMELVGYLIRTNNSDKHVLTDFSSEQFMFSKLSQDTYLSVPVKPCSKLLLTVSDKRSDFLIFSILVRSYSLHSTCIYYFTMGVVSIVGGKPRGSVLRLIPIYTDHQDMHGLELGWSLFSSHKTQYSQCLLKFMSSSSEQKNLIISTWSVDKLVAHSCDILSDDVMQFSFNLPEVTNPLTLFILYNSTQIFSNQICTFYYSRNLNKIIELRSS
ncbi:unnamed protein product [Heterobilharzia americana]|nr:unnamed protein product [Heterobilharzia americana]